MSIYHLELLDEIRQRLDDVGGDIGNPPTGYIYRWQYDDSGCLWKNTELVRYLNESIREVGLRKPVYDTDDATICTISVVANTRVYALNALILSIEEARLLSSGLPLIKTTVKRMREMIGRYRPTENWRTLTGAVTHYLEDEYERQISLYHTPSTTDSIKLSVRRMFKDTVSWTTLSSEATLTTAFTDIPDTYRKALLYGVLSQAYRKRDADTYNPQAAQEADQMLELEVGPKIPFVQYEQNRLSANLWRSKSLNETLMQRRAQAQDVPQQKAKIGE